MVRALHERLALYADLLLEHAGQIFLLVGVALLLTGLLLHSIVGSLPSTACLFSGVVLAAYGLLGRLGFFFGGSRSLLNPGVAMVCSSVVLFASAIALFQFVEITPGGSIAEIFRGYATGNYRQLFTSDRPYVGMSLVLGGVSLLVLVVGAVVRVVCDQRSQNALGGPGECAPRSSVVFWCRPRLMRLFSTFAILCSRRCPLFRRS